MQTFTQQPLTLYQLETVPVPIVDKTLNRFLHLTPNQKAIFSFKYRNIYKC